jgi:hypothetical protein
MKAGSLYEIGSEQSTRRSVPAAVDLGGGHAGAAAQCAATASRMLLLFEDGLLSLGFHNHALADHACGGFRVLKSFAYSALSEGSIPGCLLTS